MNATAAINIKYGVQRRHLQKPQTQERDQDKQDEFEDQSEGPPKAYIGEMLSASGKPAGP